MNGPDIRTENADAFDVKGPSDYRYGWPEDIFSTFEYTSAEEGWYRKASTQNPFDTILVQVARSEGDNATIYETIPSGSDFLVGSRFKHQSLKLPAGIILFSQKGLSSIPKSRNQIEESEPATITFRDSASQSQTLNIMEYSTGDGYINWARILRGSGKSDVFTLSYTDKHQVRRSYAISKKPVVGWYEFDLISPVRPETAINPEMQYMGHGGDRVVSIINVREECEKIQDFIFPENAKSVDTNSFASDARKHAEMLRQIFYGLTGTRNHSLYSLIYEWAQDLKEIIQPHVASTQNPDLLKALSSLDLKIPKVRFLDPPQTACSLEAAESRKDIDPKMVLHLRQVGQLSEVAVKRDSFAGRITKPPGNFTYR